MADRPAPARTRTGPPSPASDASDASDASAADQPLGELLASFRESYREANAATAAYRRTGAALRRRQAEVRRLAAGLARTRARLAAGREAVGRLAREQYRDGSGGLSPFLRAVLSSDPQLSLDQDHLYRRMGRVRAAAVLRLAEDEAVHRKLTGRARRAQEKRQRLADRREEQHTAARERLRAVQEALASLPS